MGKKVLLIADDDEMNRRIIRKFLKDSFDILEAGDGEETLSILRENKVDALLLDIIMPKMDGLQVLECMKQLGGNDHIGILVATSTKEKTERLALSLGADDVVSKPYDPIVIQKRLENIVMMKEAESEKQMLQNNNVEGLVKEKMAQTALQMNEISSQLHKIAEIIAINKENQKLVLGMAGDIHKEADKIMDVFREEK